MKNYKNITLLSFLAVAGMFLYSCKESSLVVDDQDIKGIYFQKDSINYSFGVTPLEVESHTLQIPLRIMGTPSESDRNFTVKVNPANTTAQANVHYQLSDQLVVKADSINAYLQIKIDRQSLEQNTYKVELNLEEDQNFKPVNENFKKVVVYFNNRVERPDWKDYAGKQTWPDYKLGNWNPLTYVKFIELFRDMKNTAPSTYDAMVKEFGEDLVNVTYGWAWSYDFSLQKYVLAPLYKYFMEDNPELGVVIPKPANY